eukprot:768668-Hanusia_phi.AAC.6
MISKSGKQTAIIVDCTRSGDVTFASPAIEKKMRKVFESFARLQHAFAVHVDVYSAQLVKQMSGSEEPQIDMDLPVPGKVLHTGDREFLGSSRTDADAAVRLQGVGALCLQAREQGRVHRSLLGSRHGHRICQALHGSLHLWGDPRTRDRRDCGGQGDQGAASRLTGCPGRRLEIHQPLHGERGAYGPSFDCEPSWCEVVLISCRAAMPCATVTSSLDTAGVCHVAVYAAQEIQAGEEITLRYLDVSVGKPHTILKALPHDLRQDADFFASPCGLD